METSSQITAVPEAAKALVVEVDFVVSTWFCSILEPFFIAQRARGQRWVKITYFRDQRLYFAHHAAVGRAARFQPFARRLLGHH